MSDFVQKIADAFFTYADSPCVTDHEGKRTLTYREVGEMAARIQAKLKSQGVTSGEPVIVDLDRVAEYTASDVAIFMMGATLVPLIPEYPQERVDFIKSDCAATTIIDESFFGDLDTFEPDYVVTPIGDDVVRLIIYTSGSTGRPKGVLFRNSALSNTYDPSRNKLDIPENHACMSPMSFVASVTEMIIRLVRGKHLHLISEDMRKDVLSLKDYIARYEIGSMFLPPSALKVFDLGGTKLEKVYTGGERVSRFKPTTFALINTYGQTETMGGLLRFAVDKEYENTPIGKPKKSATVRLEDEDGNVIEGEGEGELVATGWFASGYLNRPEESAKVFKALPDGRTEVHMGDIVRRLPDGNYLYINRKDWMVKVNGQRVDMGEVEAVMQKVDGVSAAAVRNFSNPEGQTYLCGYFVAPTGLTEDELLQAMAKSLPDYMLPSVLMRIDTMPQTVSGKTDRMSLPEPSMIDDDAEIVPPANKVEAKIIDLMKDLFHEDRIGATTDLKRLGLTSLTAVTLLVDLREMTGKKIPVTLFVENKTARDIAAAIAECPDDTIHFERKPARKYYRMLPCQALMTGICTMEPDKVVFQMPVVLTVSNHSVDEVVQVMRQVIDSHPIFKATITKRDGEYYYVRDDAAEPVVERGSLASVPSPDDLMAMVGLIPVLDHRLYELSVLDDPEGTVHVIFNMHHMVTDAFSNDIIMKEVKLRLDGGVPEPEELSAFDHIDYQEYVRDHPYYNEMDAWYDQKMANFEMCEFPKSASIREDNPNAAFTLVDGAAVEKYCERHGFQVPNFYLTLYIREAERVTGVPTLVAYVYSNREDPRFSNTVGEFASWVWARLPPEAKDPIDDFTQAERFMTELGKRLDYPEYRLADRTIAEWPAFNFDYVLNVLGRQEASDVKQVAGNLSATMPRPTIILTVSRFSQDPTKHVLMSIYSDKYYDYADMKTFADAIAERVNRVLSL